MWHELLIAGALVLVIEGLLPALNPKGYRQVMQAASQLDEKTVRITGLASMIVGAILIYFLKH